jgi:hypothetical protein
MKSHDRLAGGNEITVVHEPFDDGAAVRCEYLVAFAQGVDRAHGPANDECIAWLSL